jgi:dTDP-4-amino-4,6-dideoxygalactose transaminase
MSDIMAAIGLGQFANIEQITAHRRALARRYYEAFGPDFEAQSGAQLPLQAFDSSNYHLFQIILPDNGPSTRADFMTAMKDRFNVGTGYHYSPIHLFSLYRERGFKEGMFPVSEKLGYLTVTLPMFYAMTVADVDRAVAAVKAILIK